MAVWTLKMNIIDKTDVFEFCKSENLIGFGWGLPDKNNKNNDAIMTITDYQKIKDRQVHKMRRSGWLGLTVSFLFYKFQI